MPNHVSVYIDPIFVERVVTARAEGVNLLAGISPWISERYSNGNIVPATDWFRIGDPTYILFESKELADEFRAAFPAAEVAQKSPLKPSFS